MKTLTLYQPWAALVALGAKRIETRSWGTKYRGPLAIHVSKHFKIDYKLWWSEPFASALEGSLVHISDITRSFLPMQIEFQSYKILKENLHPGCVIATGELAGCVNTKPQYTEPKRGPEFGPYYIPFGNDIWTLTDQELAFGDYSPGRFLWLLKNVKPLPEPVPTRGSMGLWEWNNPTEEKS